MAQGAGRDISSKATAERAHATPSPIASPSSQHPLLSLQRSIGNRATTGIIQRKCAECEEPQETESDSKVQKKLALGSSDDPSEREADAVAERVASGDAAPQQVAASTGAIRRKCACGGEAKEGGACEQCGGDVPDAVRETLRAPGQMMDSSTRRGMEASFGRSFGDVRVHTGAAAARSAAAINALAYTHGRNIVFGSGRYAPSTKSGQRLLAHELTHVVQQGGASRSVQKMSLDGDVSDGAEREAASVASSIVAGDQAPTIRRAQAGVIQRQKTVEEPAGGCGICHGGAMAAGSIAHKVIQVEEFLPQGYGKMTELPLECRKNLRSRPRPDLIMLRGTTWIIGSIKPARKHYYEESKKTFIAYRDCIKKFAAKKGSPATVLPLRVPIPASGLPFPNWQVRDQLNCSQKFTINPPDEFGTYGYWCAPTRNQMRLRPACECRPKKKKDKKKKKADNKKKGKAKAKQKGPAKGAKPNAKAAKAAQRAERKAAERATRKFERELAKQATKRLAKKQGKRIAIKGIAKAVGKIALKGATRAIPVIGWILLAIDVAEAAYAIHQVAKHGMGSGEGSGGPGEGEAREGETPATEGQEKGTPGGTPEGKSEQGSDGGAEGDAKQGDQKGGEGGGGKSGGGEKEGAEEGNQEGETAEGEQKGEGGEGEGSEGHLTDEEKAQLGIFESEEEAEEHVKTLPLKPEVIEALKASSEAQQELLRAMLGKSKDGGLKITEDFVVKVLEKTASLSDDEVAALIARLEPIKPGTTLDDVVKSMEEGLKAVRAGASTTPGDKEGKPAEEGEAGSKPAKSGEKPAKSGKAGKGKGKGVGDGSSGKTGKTDGKKAGTGTGKGKEEPSTNHLGSDKAVAMPKGAGNSKLRNVLILPHGVDATTPLAAKQEIVIDITVIDGDITYDLTGVSFTVVSRTSTPGEQDGKPGTNVELIVFPTRDFWSANFKRGALGGPAHTITFKGFVPKGEGK